jgi:hypothetical protein
VASLMGLIVASLAAIFYFTRAPSADRLYETITAAVESGSDDQLVEVGPIIEQFESLYPGDARVAELKPIKEEIESQRTVRRLLYRSRTFGSESQLDPVEQAFLDCIREESRDTESAQRKLRAFVNVFRDGHALSNRQKELVDIAGRKLATLQQNTKSRNPSALDLLEEQLDWAEANLSGNALADYCRSMIELYRDKGWAEPILSRARQSLPK